MSAQQAYCALEKTLKSNGDLESVNATFYYDNLRSSRSETIDVPEDGGRILYIPQEIPLPDYVNIVFDSSFANYRPKSTSYWFNWLQAREKVSFEGWENLNTSEVTNMSSMFYALGHYETNDGDKTCTVENLDLSHFDTSKVTDMTTMFCYMFLDDGLDISSFTINPGIQTTSMMGQSIFKSITLPATANNLADDAFSYVGSANAPVTLFCPKDFTPNGATQGNGYIQWKGGCFKETNKEAYYTVDYEFDDPGSGIAYVKLYYDNQRGERNNTYLIPKNGGKLNLPELPGGNIRINIDSSFAEYRPTNTSRWFNYTLKSQDNSYITSFRIDGMENLNTSEVTDMSYMFSGINALVLGLDLTHFDTSKVTDMSYMFYNLCHGGSSEAIDAELDLSSFTFNSSTNTTGLFEGAFLVELTIPSSANVLNPNAFLNMNSADDPCTLVCPKDFTPNGATQGNGYIQWKGGYFATKEAYYTVINNDAGDRVTVTLYYDDQRGKRSNTYLIPEDGGKLNVPSVSFDCSIDINIDSSFAEYRPTNTSSWFSYTPIISKPLNVEVSPFSYYFNGMENLNTSEVTDMSYMFSGINPTNLALDLTHFDTSKVTDMSYMFYNVCHGGRSDSRDAELDLSSFTFKSSTNTTGLLEGAFLNELTIPASANYLASDAFLNMNSADDPGILVCPDYFTPQGATQGNGYIQWKGGYFKVVNKEAYALVSSDGETMTFYYDEKRNSRTEGTTYLANNKINYDPEWFGTVETIKKVVFHPSFAYARPTNTSLWFNGMKNLTSIEDIKYLNTSEVTHTISMFKDCKNLKTLDVSNFNTDKVEDMANMFSGCNSLEALDVSNFNTDKVTNFSSMFLNCSSLKTLNVYNFYTDRATDMSGFFAGCSNLETLDVSNFYTDNVMLMPFMFAGCSNLKTLDLSNFNTDKVTNMNYMFNDCSSLESLDLSSFNTENVSDMSRMFYNCTKLEALDLSKFTFNTTIEKTIAMMSNCNNLKLLSIPASANILAANACNEVGTEENPCILKYPEEASADLGIPEEYDNFFRWKAGYFTDVYPYAVLSDDNQTLTFYYDDQSNQRSGTVFLLNYGDDAPKWFYSVSSVSLVKFNPSFADARPKSTSCWFDNMKYLETIEDIEYLNTEQVTDMASMFSGCSNLKTIDLSNFNTANVTDMRSMFFSCTSLESLDLSNFNTDNVTSMGSMFSNCSSLESLDLSNFNTANVTDMRSMFSNCTSLKSLDLSSFNTAKVTNMVAMFSKCTSMETLDLSNFTFDASNDTYYMMYGCNNLKLLSIPASVNNLEASTCRGVGTEENPCILKYPEEASADLGIPEEYDNYFIWKDGYFTDIYPYAVLSDDNQTLTFYYDDQSNQRSGTVYMLNYGDEAPKWLTPAASVTHVKFYPSFANARPESTSCWFDNMKYLETIEGIEYLNTEQVTNMALMFYGASSLKEVDLSHFNTSKVTNMALLFSYSSNLQSVDVSHFDTSNVTNMVMMFYNCSSLESLDLSSFTFIEKDGLSSLFLFNCSALQELTLPATGNRLPGTSCNQVGTAENPCLLNGTGGFTPEGAETHDDYFIWRGGHFKTGSIDGDANGDDRVTIADVMMTVKASAGDYLNGFIEKNADVNHDNTINVTDVMLIVKMLQ